MFFVMCFHVRARNVFVERLVDVLFFFGGGSRMISPRASRAPQGALWSPKMGLGVLGLRSVAFEASQFMFCIHFSSNNGQEVGTDRPL